MKKNVLFFILICFCSIAIVEAQNDINKYKYLVIPVQFEFKKGKNPLKLSTLTRFLFNKEGFTTYYEGEKLPDDLFDDRCLASYAEIVELKEGFRLTRLKILLKDCKDNIIFESVVGDSGENNHEKRYHEALREAFESIKKMNYNYQPPKQEKSFETEQVDMQFESKKSMTEQLESTEGDDKAIEKVENIEKEVKNLHSPIKTKEKNTVETVLMSKEEESKGIVQEKLHQERYPQMAISQLSDAKSFMAKKVDKGYKIYSVSSNQYQFTMYSTILNGVYIFKNKVQSGSITKRENGNWVMESINDGSYIIEKINLSFQ